MLVAATTAQAQSSVNTFSAYTFGGLGDLRTQGAANLRGTGGAGVAERGFVNTMNPASLSVLPRNTFNFNFGMEAGFFYLKEDAKKTSYNSMNISDLTFHMPLARKLGFGMSLSPFSSVGYRVREESVDESVLAGLYPAGIAGANFLYEGSGDVSQAKVSLGWEPVKRLSVGIDMIYYFGDLEHKFAANLIAADPDESFVSPSMSRTIKISRIHWGFGAQYNIIQESRKWLTAGATYRPGGKLGAKITRSAKNIFDAPQILSGDLRPEIELPAVYAGGMHYRAERIGAGLDYEYQGWAAANGSDMFRNTNAVRAGFEYTPRRYDVRRPMNRVAYRAGVRYNDYYMLFGGREISDKAVTLGLGIPFKLDRESYLDLAFEVGQRGSTALVKENYFKISIGFRLFGEGWFQKMQYL